MAESTSGEPVDEDNPLKPTLSINPGRGKEKPAVRTPGVANRRSKSWQLPKWLKDRDWALLVLLLLLNIGSAYTTIIGARQILPAGMSDILGAAVQAMLFLMLAGFAVNRSVIRRWIAITLFAGASIYTSFFTYYGELAAEADLRNQMDKAMQEHATLVSKVYQPARGEASRIRSQAETKLRLADEEAARGGTTGIKGYGPRARAYAEEGNKLLVEAMSLEADVERLKNNFEYELVGLVPEQVYQRDLEAWQLAPNEWKEGVPAPERDDYVDLSAEVALLTPFNRVRAGDMPAITALFLAAMVDGIAIFLGTAIQARQRPPMEVWSEQVAGMISQVRKSRAMVKAAMDGSALPDQGFDEPLLDDALQIMHLRIAGKGSDFLSTFYQAIHPETGALDYAGLQRHANATYRIAARMLVDQLRAPELGWVEVEGGWWRVPEEAYPQITAWLGEQIRNECEIEAKALDQTSDEVQEPERTLRLVIPAA